MLAKIEEDPLCQSRVVSVEALLKAAEKTRGLKLEEVCLNTKNQECGSGQRSGDRAGQAKPDTKPRVGGGAGDGPVGSNQTH